MEISVVWLPPGAIPCTRRRKIGVVRVGTKIKYYRRIKVQLRSPDSLILTRARVLLTRVSIPTRARRFQRVRDDCNARASIFSSARRSIDFNSRASIFVARASIFDARASNAHARRTRTRALVERARVERARASMSPRARRFSRARFDCNARAR